MLILGYIASLLMGITLGVLGGGGSIMTVPIMVYLFGVSPLIATGYSLFVVGITALIGSIMYIKKGDVDFKIALPFAIPSIIGVNLSRGLILPNIPKEIVHLGNFVITKEILIMGFFAVLMIAASNSMLRKKSERKPMETHPIFRMIAIGLQGLIVGVIAGFVGAGGGFLIIPVLVLMAGLVMRKAIGTSLMIIAFQSLFGFAGDVSRGLIVEWTLIGAIAVIAVVGIILGSAIAHKVQEQKLKKAFGVFVLLMGSSILIEQFRHIS